MQLNDSAFPSGAFVHSYGLEQLVRERRITTASDLERFVTSNLHQSLATADAPAAFAAASASCLEDIVALDRALFATKAASELREACVTTGRRFLEESYPFSPREWDRVRVCVPFGDQVTSYHEAVLHKASPGCYPVAFGVVCQALGVEATDVPGAYLLGAVTAILQSALRLMRVSHRDVQSTLHRLRPQIADISDQIASVSAAIRLSARYPLAAFNPLQDIASMRHQRADARLFAS